MAETPKGDTASPTDAEDRVEAGPDSTPDGTIAGDVGRDRLASADAADADAGAGPWSAAPTEPSDADPAVENRIAVGPAAPAGDDEPADDARSGSLRGTLILVILLALVVGGAYASYPMWRGQVEPLARQLGITLPQAGSAPAPAPAQTPQTAEPAVPAPEPAAPASPAPASPAPASPAPASPETAEGTASTGEPPADAEPPAQPPAQPPAPPAAVEDPALAGDLDRLQDRVNALEQRLSAVESREPPAPGADPAALEQLEKRVGEMEQSLTAVTDEVAIVREGLAGSGGGEGLGPMAAQLSERLRGLTDRMDALEETAGAPPPEPAVKPEQVDELRARQDALRTRLDTLAGSLDSEVRKSAEDVAGLETRLETRLTDMQGELDRIAAALESTRSGREQAGAFLLAANQLAAAAAGSGSFETELEAVQAAAPAGDEAARALETLAQRSAGVPSLAVLRDRFAKTASDAVDAAVVGSDEGMLGQAMRRVASLVSVRRIAPGEGDGLDALLVRAESALAAGDLAGAIEAVRRLEGDAARAAAGWLDDAEARAAVDGAVRTLQAQALAGVAGG